MKWIKRCLVTLLIFGVVLFASLILYVEQEETTVEQYAASLSALPEIESVQRISKFNGTKTYFVADVTLKSGVKHVYFIHEDQVVHYEPKTNIQPVNKILEAVRAVNENPVAHYYLGMYEDQPVYEVAVTSKHATHYVIVDAKSAEILDEFEIK